MIWAGYFMFLSTIVMLLLAHHTSNKKAITKEEKEIKEKIKKITYNKYGPF